MSQETPETRPWTVEYHDILGMPSVSHEPSVRVDIFDHREEAHLRRYTSEQDAWDSVIGDMDAVIAEARSNRREAARQLRRLKRKRKGPQS